MLLNVRDAKSNEVDFAWPLYRDFVRTNIFDGQPGKAPKSDWDEKKEQKKFSKYWETGSKYIIEIDANIIGWASTSQTGTKLVIENFFIGPEWQDKGIAEKIFEEMIPKWKQQNLIVEVPVLKNAPVSAGVERALQKLGFKPSTDSALASVLCADWTL